VGGVPAQRSRLDLAAGLGSPPSGHSTLR
jgi:hypothetical protein